MSCSTPISREHLRINQACYGCLIIHGQHVQCIIRLQVKVVALLIFTVCTTVHMSLGLGAIHLSIFPTWNKRKRLSEGTLYTVFTRDYETEKIMKNGFVV